MVTWLGPPDSRLRRTRSVVALALAVLLVVVVVCLALGRVLPAVWAVAFGATLVAGHLLTWPRGEPDADLTFSVPAAVATGVTVGVASGFALVLQGGETVQGLVQSAVTVVVAVPLLLAVTWWQRRRTP
ncbi:hypothetical protein [Nocardioides marmoraquaticus]